MDNNKIIEEKEYLQKVKKVMNEIIAESNKNINLKKENIDEMKKFMWDNLSDFTDEERALAMYDVDKDVNIANSQIKKIIEYEKALNNPYFGKVCFYNDRIKKEQKIYIGMSSIQKDLKFYVFDWRAPISSLFYNFELGDAYYQAPSGIINGEILSKMQFKIEKGKLIRCFNSDINIDDEYLQEILANSSNEKMKNIVSTIQREQNEIIRNDKDKILIVQGAAGSGKTSVSLHRIAYLLYKDKNLTSNNVLIFSPTDVFSDYISNVLPELGEENTLTSTYSDFSTSFLKPIKKIESYTEYLEKIYTSEYNQILKYKSSDNYINDLKKFLNSYLKNNEFKNKISINGKVISCLELKELFENKYVNFPIKERIDLIAEKLCYNNGISRKNKNKLSKLIKESCSINFDIFEIYNRFLVSKNIDKEEFKKINYEDITGLLYIFFELNGYPVYPNIKHVVIDEAQDYSKFQMEIIGKIFKKSSFTILGDVNQTINKYSKYSGLNELLNIFNNSRYIELNKTYRSSEEIINYSNNILGINNICAIRNANNNPVEIINENIDFSNITEYIKNAHNKKIAIITKNALNAQKIFNFLEKEQNNCQLIIKETSNITKPVIIIPAYLSKGLEFDEVIVYNEYDSDYTKEESNLYYVVCTRAQHKLIIFNEPQEIVKSKTKIKNK